MTNIERLKTAIAQQHTLVLQNGHVVKIEFDDDGSHFRVYSSDEDESYSFEEINNSIIDGNYFFIPDKTDFYFYTAKPLIL